MAFIGEHQHIPALPQFTQDLPGQLVSGGLDQADGIRPAGHRRVPVAHEADLAGRNKEKGFQRLLPLTLEGFGGHYDFDPQILAQLPVQLLGGSQGQNGLSGSGDCLDNSPAAPPEPLLQTIFLLGIQVQFHGHTLLDLQ